MKAKILGLLTAGVLSLVTGEASATTLGANLVVNGNAQASTTPTGWTVVKDSDNLGICVTTSASQATTAGLAAGVVIGTRSFWGCGVDQQQDYGASTKSMSQRIDVSDLATLIDGGLIQADWATLLQSRATDTVTATLTLLDSSKAQLGSFTYVDTNGLNAAHTGYAAYDWSSITDSFALVSGTRFVDVKFVFHRTSGWSTDAFADNISLELRQTEPSSVPEPGTLALLGLGLAGLGLSRRRKTA